MSADNPSEENTQSTGSTADVDDFAYLDVEYAENLHLLDYDEFEHAQFAESSSQSEPLDQKQYWLRGSPSVSGASGNGDNGEGQSDSDSSDSDNESTYSQSSSSCCISSDEQEAQESHKDQKHATKPNALNPSTRQASQFKKPYTTSAWLVHSQDLQLRVDELPDLSPVSPTLAQPDQDICKDPPPAKRRRESTGVVKKPTTAPSVQTCHTRTGNVMNNNASIDEPCINLLEDLLVSSSSSEDALPEFNC
jgi:hypothetical protein